MNGDSSSRDVQSKPSVIRRLFRGLAFILLGIIGGAAVGFVVFLLLNSTWDLLSDWLKESVPQRRGRGGDPVNRWARGYVRMFYCTLLMIPFAALGLVLGVRVALLESITFRNLCEEVRNLLNYSIAIFFSTNELWGSCCLIQAILFWPVGILGISSLGRGDSPAIILTLLALMIAGSTFCGLKGLKSIPRNKSVVGLLFTCLNVALLSKFLIQIGLDRIR